MALAEQLAGTNMLRLQLLSSAQDKLAVDALRLLEPFVSWRYVTLRSRWWAKGWIKGPAFSSIDGLVDGLSKHQVNEVEVAFKVSVPYEIPPARFTVRSIRCSLAISPTNSLWAQVTGFSLPRHEDELQRASYESREQSLKWSGIQNCPTLLDAQFEIDAVNSGDELLRAFWEAIPGTVATSATWKSLCGCADLHDPMVFRGNILESLAPWPKTYPLLGGHFDDLHPILLGPISTCEALGEALGEQVRLRRMGPPEDSGILGLLWLPLAVVGDPRTRALARPWLVPRGDSMKPRDLDSSRGEFRVGGKVFYSQRRTRELRAQGVLPTLPRGFREFQLIASKYCLLLDIDSEEMPVELWQEPLITRAQQEIDRVFDALSVDIPLIERVWRAHEPTYRKWLYASDEPLHFLKESLYAAHARRESTRSGTSNES